MKLGSFTQERFLCSAVISDWNLYCTFTENCDKDLNMI